MKPYYEHAGITIYHGDCREVLPSLSAKAVIQTRRTELIFAAMHGTQKYRIGLD